jgi:ferrous iron transport protein B
VTHRFLGLPLLLLVMFGIFQTLFTAAAPLMSGLEWLFGRLAAFVAPLLPEGALQSLVVDGLIGGVGGVVVFVPQIALLFALIAILEDCGYLSRAAYMLDRTMRFAGLSGRSFIPLLSAFACAVPAILGARSIADRRERRLAIFLAPFMSCSARLPVYVLLISAFVPATALFGWLGLQGVVLFAMYLVGALTALPLAWLLRRTVLHGPPPPFVLELPGYKIPRLGAIWQRVSNAVREFLVRAGTVILLVNLVVWALAYFPRSDAVDSSVRAVGVAAGWDEDQTEHALAAAHLENSYLGRMGHGIEPVIRPLGWDWRIGMAVLASFPAREVVIGTLGTIFSLGGEVDESSEELKDALHSARRSDGAPLVTLPVALGVMVFFALCAQCSSTLVVMGRELRSWKWPVASFLTMTSLAYLGAWLTHAVGIALFS